MGSLRCYNLYFEALKGALKKYFKIFFWLKFIYQVKNWLLIYKYKKKNSKIHSKSEALGVCIIN